MLYLVQDMRYVKVVNPKVYEYVTQYTSSFELMSEHQRNVEANRWDRFICNTLLRIPLEQFAHIDLSLRPRGLTAHIARSARTAGRGS